MMTTDSRGLYVHIPFCLKKCNYCDFCSFKLSSVDWRQRYVDCLCEEIASYKDRHIVLDTVFFGGGTPSLLTVGEFSRIVGQIRRTFDVLPDCEFTVEANPKTLDLEKLRNYVSLGVNRLSIGLQSIHENELKILGRVHNFADFLESYRLAREAGIGNINIDLMYAIPTQTKDSFKETLETVIGLEPEHISLYGLILEEGTPLYDMRDSLAFPGEDAECAMYEIATDMLGKKGYVHYEISNYARHGRESRHNLKYWHTEEYIGVGLNAHSFLEGRRFFNTDDIELYLSGAEGSVVAEESGETDREEEYIMLALRLSEGLSLSDYRKRFGKEFYVGKEPVLSELEAAGLVNLTNDRLSLTERGFYVSNSIICELI